MWEHSLCNFSTNFFGGGREVAQGGNKILPKVLAKFWDKFVSSKFHQTATLVVWGIDTNEQRNLT